MLKLRFEVSELAVQCLRNAFNPEEEMHERRRNESEESLEDVAGI